MLILGIGFEDIADAALEVFIRIGIHINSMIYNFVTFLFDIFITIISAEIFNSTDYAQIANSVYLVIGVVALFIVAYALLRAIIDPDGASKGNYSAKKIVPNIVISVVLIALVPTAFRVGYGLQKAVFDTNIIPNVIFGRQLSGTDYTEDECDVTSNKTGENCSSGNYLSASGRKMANDVFVGFFVPTREIDVPEGSTYSAELAGYYQKMEVKECFLVFCDDETINFQEVVDDVSRGKRGFGAYGEFAGFMFGKDDDENNIEYNWLLQLISGIFLAYVLLNFCIDMAVRAVKLGYFQIIAPIPILTLMLPGQKKIFDNWFKNTMQTFLDVFLRLFIIFMGVLLINNLPDLNTMWTKTLTSPAHPLWAKAFIIIGILIFMKQAPKLLADIFGISSGSFKLGIADKLGEMAFVGSQAKQLASAVPGAVTGAAGAAWTAKANGSDWRHAARLGALRGAQGGGNQFSKQRAKVWEGDYGMKGPAGLFGGRTMMSKWTDDLSTKVNNDFLQFDESKGLGSNSRRLNEMLTDPKHNAQYLEIMARDEKVYNTTIEALRDAENKYMLRINTIQGDITSQNSTLTSSKENLEKLNSDYDKAFKESQQQYIDMLGSKREAALASGNATEVAYYGQKIAEVQSGHAESDVLDYIKSTNYDAYQALNDNRNSVKTLENTIESLNQSIAANQASLEATRTAMANDDAVKAALKAVNDLTFFDESGAKIDTKFASSAEITDAIMKSTIANQAKDDLRKENFEFKWRSEAEEKERRETEISKAKKDPSNQALADLVGSVLAKNSGDKK